MTTTFHYNREKKLQVKITSRLMYGTGLTISVDTFVHYRRGDKDEWELATNNIKYATPNQLLKNRMLTLKGDFK